MITTTQQVCKNSQSGFGQKCTYQQVKTNAYACTLYGVSDAGNPATWKTAPTSNTCGYLTGTSSYPTSINQVTWNLAGKATELGTTGLSLATCAQLCISSASCFAWTWTLVIGRASPVPVSTCYSLGFITGATPSTSLPTGLVISSSVSTLTPGTALTGGSPPYSTPNGRTAMLCLAACVADTNCAGG